MSETTIAAWLSQLRTMKDAYAERDPRDGIEVENAYRRGYLDAVAAAIDLLGQGATPRQLDAWRWGALQKWRSSDMTSVTPPPMPEPWREIRKRIFARDGNACAYCGKDGATHIDHVVPVSAGGSYEDDNLVVSCRECNLSKGTKFVEEWQRE